MFKRLPALFILLSCLTLAQPSHAFFGKLFEPMTEMIKQAGGVANNMIDTGGSSFSQMVQLTGKLSDDIGKMANRILVMADKIGEMADRIVRTEELMAQVAQSIATGGKGGANNDELIERLDRIEMLIGSAASVVLSIGDTFAASNFGPTLEISDNPEVFMLYVSYNGLFAEGQTIVTQVDTADDTAYDAAWEKSVSILTSSKSATVKVSVAIKSIAASGAVSTLSNGVEVTLQ
ncbi:MAG: hypothetical protein HOM11_10225 [Methylococcales bacterium]|jgi:hypothetical protein|nr:hypothetical protein [Methylococcales bacterium]MBT7445406.1 hypothetical protein [Methylococcales bacterium]